MSDYVISCCSTADLDPAFLAEKKLECLFFHFSIDGKEYQDDMGVSYPFKQFYADMEEGKITKTSQISAGEYLEFFEQFLSQGKDVIHCTLSSGISGTYQSACTAADILREKYPDRNLYIIDSLGASSGYGLLMAKLSDLRAQGMTIQELREWAESHKLEAHHWFFSTDLKYYVRGGRISKASGFFGTLLKICPLLNVDDLGRLIPREKIRTIKKVERALVDKMAEFADNGKDYDGEVFISNSNCPEFVDAVIEMINADFPKVSGKIKVFSIGTTIGSHTGPGTVALFFWGKKRTC